MALDGMPVTGSDGQKIYMAKGDSREATLVVFTERSPLSYYRTTDAIRPWQASARSLNPEDQTINRYSVIGEDEESVRKCVVSELKRLGYRVVPVEEVKKMEKLLEGIEGLDGFCSKKH